MSAAGRSASSRPSTCWSNWCARSATSRTSAAPKGSAGWSRSLHTLRRMSVSVNGMLQAGKEPVVEGSIVKDMGTVWEQKLPGRVRELAAFIEEDRRQPRDAGRAAALRHHDRAQAHHPGRHHRSPARHHRARLGSALNAGHPKAALARVGRDHRGVVGYARPARPHRADHAQPSLRGRGLSGEPQRDGGAGAQGLQDRRRPARARRSRGADHSGEVRAAGARALRRRRHQGGDHSLLRLRRGEGRDRAGAAARGAGDRREIRHGGERTERRGLRQHRCGAVPDLQSRDGRRRRAAAAAARSARAARSR